MPLVLHPGSEPRRVRDLLPGADDARVARILGVCRDPQAEQRCPDCVALDGGVVVERHPVHLVVAPAVEVAFDLAARVEVAAGRLAALDEERVVSVVEMEELAEDSLRARFVADIAGPSKVTA